MKRLKLIDKSKLLVFFLCIYMCCGVCKAIDSNLLLILMSTGSKYLHIDGLKIGKYQGRTITVENAEVLARLLVEYNITNLNLQNLNFDPGALLIILKVFNNGYFTFKNCHLDENGFLVLLDYYIQKKKAGEIIFESVDVEFKLNGSLQQIDLTTVNRDSEAKERIRQMAILLLRNNSENMNRIIIWFNENGIFGNHYNVADIPPLPLTMQEQARRPPVLHCVDGWLNGFGANTSL